MALTIAQFIALFVLSCVSGVFTGIAISIVWGVWGGIKPLTRRLNDVESDLGALEGRFGKHQKRAAADKSAETREMKMPPEIQALLSAQANRQHGEATSLEFVG